MSLGRLMALNEWTLAHTADLRAVMLRIEMSRTGVFIAPRESGPTGTAMNAAHCILIQGLRRHRLAEPTLPITHTVHTVLEKNFPLARHLFETFATLPGTVLHFVLVLRCPVSCFRCYQFFGSALHHLPLF